MIIADDKNVISKHLFIFIMFVCFVIFQPVHNADFIVPVEIDGTIHQVKKGKVFKKKRHPGI